LNRDNVIKLYDRLAGLVDKLPGGLQKPILRELTPIREVFLEQRPARLLLIGEVGRSVPEFLNQLCPGAFFETGPSDNGWRTYSLPERGEVQILDARADVPREGIEAALERYPADLLLYPVESGDSLTLPVLETAAWVAETAGRTVPLIGIVEGDEALRARFSALLPSRKELASRRWLVTTFEPAEALAEMMCSLLPDSAKLEFARLSGAKQAQAQIAKSLLKSFTAVCGVIGVQPIPLADMPVLTALQTLMVGLIIHTTGRNVSPRLIAEFLGALGLNVGAGILFREGARALVRIVPFWGNAVSGIVAGAGTYAIGRAAIAYFIEDTPLTETRKLFHHLLPGWFSFRKRQLPMEKEVNLPEKTGE